MISVNSSSRPLLPIRVWLWTKQLPFCWSWPSLSPHLQYWYGSMVNSQSVGHRRVVLVSPSKSLYQFLQGFCCWSVLIVFYQNGVFNNQWYVLACVAVFWYQLFCNSCFTFDILNVCISRWSINLLCIQRSAQCLDCKICKTWNCWCSVDTHFQDVVGSMSLVLLTLLVANISELDVCNESEHQFCKMQSWK
jgi:hypothetical protein